MRKRWAISAALLLAGAAHVGLGIVGSGRIGTLRARLAAGYAAMAHIAVSDLGSRPMGGHSHGSDNLAVIEGPAILGDTVPVACAALPGARPSIAVGDVVALAVTGSARWYDLPATPTMLELGYPHFVSDTFHGAWAPANTPPQIAVRLTTAMLDSLKQPAFHEQLRSLGFEVIGNGPDGLRKRIATEVPMYRALIAHAGIEQV